MASLLISLIISKMSTRSTRSSRSTTPKSSADTPNSKKEAAKRKRPREQGHSQVM